MVETAENLADVRRKSASREERRGGLPLRALEALQASGLLRALEDREVSPGLASVRDLARTDGSTAAIVGAHIAATTLVKRAFESADGSAEQLPLRSLSGLPRLRGARGAGGWQVNGMTEIAAGGGTAQRLTLLFEDERGDAFAADLPSATARPLPHRI